jgi:serine/threonine protein kinase
MAPPQVVRHRVLTEVRPRSATTARPAKIRKPSWGLLFHGEAGSEASHQFALGVTLYRMFTGQYPYGEVEAFSRPRFDKPQRPSRFRPDMPAWLEATLLRAVAVDPDERFGDVIELLRALEDGGTRAIGSVHKPRSLN